MPPGKMISADSPLSIWNKSMTAFQKEIKDESPLAQNLSPGDITVNTKRLADMLEAIVGAFFVSGGLDSGKFALTAFGFDRIHDDFSVIANNVRNVIITDEPEIPEGYPPLLRKLACCSDEESVFAEYKQLQIMRSNVSLTCGTVSKMVESVFGYKFQDEELLSEAFTHSSVLGIKNNQRLEFLGDAVLDVTVVWILFQYPEQLDQGRLSECKSANTNNSRLGTFGIKLGLHRYLFAMSEELATDFKDIQRILEDNNELAVKDSTLHAIADCFEALIGAIFIDSEESLETVTGVLKKIEFIEFS